MKKPIGKVVFGMFLDEKTYWKGGFWDVFG